MKTTCVQVLPGHDIVSKSNTIIKFISLKKSFFCVSCASIGTVFEVFGKKKMKNLLCRGNYILRPFLSPSVCLKIEISTKLFPSPKNGLFEKKQYWDLCGQKLFASQKVAPFFPLRNVSTDFLDNMKFHFLAKF